MKGDRLTADDIAEWVQNDEGLYRMWKREGGRLREFIRKHRGELESAIRNVRDGVKPAHYLAYGV